MAPLDSQRSFECSDVVPFADAYVDGEFEAPERSMLEQHLEACGGCRVELQRIAALRSLLRARIGRSVPAPEALRSRIHADLDQVERDQALPPAGFKFRLEWRRFIMPVLFGASAAGALSILYVTVVPQRADRWMVGDAAEMHARSLPLEISTARLEQLMPLFERHLGFAVRPPSFQSDGLRLEGGRLSHLGPHDAAYLQYGDQRNGGRLSLFIVEDPGAELRLAGARRAILNNHEVFLSHAHGHSVVVWRNQDVLYSLVSDLGEEETLALLARTHVDGR